MKQYLPLVVLLGLVALYSRFTTLVDSRSPHQDQPSDRLHCVATPPPDIYSPVAEQTPVAALQTDLELFLPERGVEVLQSSNGRALLRIDMKGHQRLLVTAHFSSPSKDWSLNMGDSISNNGWGGDGSTNFHDAEVQILNGSFDIYASDAVGNAPPFDGGKRSLKTWPGVASAPGVVQFEIADGEVVLYRSEGDPERFQHDALFALNGQPDSEASVNYDLFLGINRVVSSGRTGSGVSKLELAFR